MILTIDTPNTLLIVVVYEEETLDVQVFLSREQERKNTFLGVAKLAARYVQ